MNVYADLVDQYTFLVGYMYIVNLFHFHFSLSLSISSHLAGSFRKIFIL